MIPMTIPYAVADYGDLRERGFYYVDKTGFIPKLELYNAPVFLRPRRFGKSLLVSMLAHYYDRTKADRFDSLFGQTWIGAHPTPEHNRYMVSRYLSDRYTFSIEQNNAAGRADFEMTGIPGTEYYLDHRIVEFKYFRAREAGTIAGLTLPRPEDVAQVHAYADDTHRRFPTYQIRSYVVYICARKVCRCWEV